MAPGSAQVVILGENPLSDVVVAALTKAGVDTIVRPGDRFAPGATFDLLLDADLLVDAGNDDERRYLANDAAAIRAIPMVWGSVQDAVGRAGVAWDERGVDYRDLFPEHPGATVSPARPPRPDLCALVGARMAEDALALLSGSGEDLPGRVTTYDAVTGATSTHVHRRDPRAARPGSLEERTALREPGPERSVTAAQLAKLLAGPTTGGVHETPPVLLDVRERPEASFASLPGSVLIPLGELPGRLAELPARDTSIVVYCHHGVRSARALEVLEGAGFTRIRHLTGGIDAWSVQVDPALPRY